MTEIPIPDRDDVESEFQQLVDEHDQPDFHGGVFEGSHYYGDAIVLRLYSIVPGDGPDQLRIETRHHYGGAVLDHRRTEHELTDDLTVKGTEKSLEEFCREHHFESPREELRTVIESADLGP